MLFHITHKHDAQTCPAHDPKLVRETWGKVWANVGSEIELKSAYVNAPAHTIYMVIETDDVKKIEDFLFPVFKIGTADISPVVDARETTKKFS